jgi:tRNA(fMet)-specific endonuclease VapC
MAVVLLDTNVASFLHPKKRNSPQRTAYAPELLGQTLALSFQSVAELLHWAEEKRWGPRQREALDRFIERFVVVPFDTELARAWARVMTHSRSIGRRLEAGDAWIAATALRHGLRLVTHDADLASLRMPGVDVIHRRV